MNVAKRGLAALALLAMAGTAFAQHVPDYEPGFDAGYTGSYDFSSDQKTAAGETVSNKVEVSYMVEGVAQTAEWNTDDGTETGNVDPGAEFLVDRVILVNVFTADTAKTVAQLQTNAYLTFEARNDSNDTVDLVLSLHEQGDAFTGATFALYEDTNDNGTFESGTDQLVTGSRLQNMTQGEMRLVFAVGDIPDALANGDEHDLTLMATAHVAGGGAAYTETTGANTAGVDTVFGDLAGDFLNTVPDPDDQDEARDGRHSDSGAFSVAATTINVSKTSAVVEDPFNGTTNPKAIPGATVLYCIAVENAGTSDATNVSISDVVPDHTTYLEDSIRVANGAVTSCDDTAHGAAAVTITDDNTDDGTESTTNSGISGNSQGPGDLVPTVRTLVESLDAAQTTTTLFKVTIN